MNHRRYSGWCRHRAGYGLVCALALGMACDDANARRPSPPQQPARVAASEPDAAPTGPPLEARYYDGYLAEVVRGDIDGARAIYLEVMTEASQSEPTLAARAALRLAELEARAGSRGEALELVARAMAIGGRDPDIVQWVDRLQLRLEPGAARRQVRGPPLGTTPAGVTEPTAEAFQRAERLSESYYRVSTPPRVEDLWAGVRVRERAAEAAVAAYEVVVQRGEPMATAAASLRIATVYHDLAIVLAFFLPPELEGEAREASQQRLTQKARVYLRKAERAYERCITAAPHDVEAERWQRAAQLGLESARDLLRGG